MSGDNAPTSVIVAKSLIPAGTSGTIIATKQPYQATTLPQKDIKVGAISDPAYINGRVAITDIVPGQQMTTADFSVPTTTAVTTKITGKQRAISVSVDNVHGSLSQLAANDHIDIYVGLGSSGGQSIVKLFRPNVKVLAVPGRRRREPDPADQHQGRGRLRLRGGQHAVLLRAPPAGRREAHRPQYRVHQLAPSNPWPNRSEPCWPSKTDSTPTTSSASSPGTMRSGSTASCRASTRRRGARDPAARPPRDRVPRVLRPCARSSSTARCGRPDRPVIILADGSPAGFVRRIFELGAEDILLLPQSGEQVRFAIHKTVQRRLGSNAAPGRTMRGSSRCSGRRAAPARRSRRRTSPSRSPSAAQRVL